MAEGVLGVLIMALLVWEPFLWIGPVVKGRGVGIPLGFMEYQPSEVAKLACIVVAVGYLDRHRSQITDLRRVSLPLCWY